MEPLVVEEISLTFQRMVTVLFITAMDLEELSYLQRLPDHMNSVGQVETGLTSQVIMAEDEVVEPG